LADPSWELRRLTAPDGTNLAVHVAGSGPVLLCVPGGPGRASAYLQGLGGLTSDRTLWRVDLRGTGLSDLPDDRDSLAFPRLADDLSPVVAAAGGGPVDVLAHSAGCHVAMVFASRYPQLVRRLVLVTPSANGLADAAEIWPDIARIRALRSAEPWYAEVAAIEVEIAQLPEDRRRRLDRGLRPYFYARWDEAAQAHAAATDQQMSLRATAAFRPEHGDPAELVEMLRTIAAPTLIVVGGLDGITGTAPGRIVAAALPSAASVDVIELPGAGHNPWIDDPSGFAALVTGWLRDTA
jgi:pimeloyl-ACP methyl ester carboxylesterase